MGGRGVRPQKALGKAEGEGGTGGGGGVPGAQLFKVQN